MAAKKATVAKPRTPKPEFVTEAQLDAKLDAFGSSLIDKVAELMHPVVSAGTPVIPAGAIIPGTVAPETPLDKEVRKAGPDQGQVNPEWDEKAREILGEKMERTEFIYLKTGGVVFSVYIKPEFSNASEAYLDEMKVDKRSKEIGQEGTTGVESWCKLIAQNLQRPRAN